MAAELVTSLVSPIMEKLGELIFAKVKRQFTYLCCFNSNIESLREEAENLKNVKDGLQRRVDTAKRNTDDILPVVDTWLKRSDEIHVHTNGIEEEIRNVKSGCLAIKSRFLLSRKAKKTADAINLHREKGKFEEISIPALPTSLMAPVPQARKPIENEIMEDLRRGKVHMMGICGMRGVGKTTIAKRIMNMVKEEELFEEVEIIVISREVHKFEIQQKIAEKFGMKKLEEETLSARALKLRLRLTGAKRILLILDDIWEKLDLESLGIPCKSDEGEGCTILLISRSRYVLNEMNAKRFGVQTLAEEEALSLFRGKIGTCAVDEGSLPMKEIVKKCKGLPLAIVTVGAALKDKSIDHWDDALIRLSRPNSDQLPEYLEEIYNPIKLSYDFLENRCRARSLLLLCSLFREDCDIDLEHLMIYGMGLRMFTDEIRTLKEARDRVHVLVDSLKSCFLLLDGSDANHVKMHDAVRDAAIYIASVEESINCKWISVVGEEINKLPISSEFPNLGPLLLDNHSTEFEIKDPSLFKGMAELSMLSFCSISFKSLPETTQLLKNLWTLYLEDCDSLKTIYTVRELLNLEILICRSCYSIAELPVEIRRSEKLRILEIYKCRELKKIARGVISNLVRLEELTITESFNGWETVTYEEQRGNAAICEIEHLENLTRLEIKIEDSPVVAEMMFLRMLEIKIEDSTVAAETFPVGGYMKYQIRFGGSHWESCELDDTRGFARWVKDIVDAMVLLKHDRSTCYLWRNRNQSPPDHFFRRLEAIEIYDCSAGSLFHSLTAVNLDDLKELRISKCTNMVQVIENEEQFVPLKLNTLFPSLHSLYLEDLPELKSFSSRSRELNLASLENVWIKGCHRLEFFALQSVELHSLKKVVIRDCNKIGSLFSPHMAANLGNLMTLSISRCKEMVQVVEKNDTGPRILFPDLKELEFHDLPKLQNLSTSEYDLELPSLESVQIKGCHRLEFFRLQNVQLRSLKKVVIIDCNHIGSLFSASMAVNLHNLMTLSISGCKEMVQVIESNTEQEFDILSSVLFPNLKELEFRHLSKLQNFFNLEYDLELSSLENLCMYSCPLWEKFSRGSLNAPKLKRVEINSKVINTGTTLEWLNTTALREANQFHQLNATAEELESSSVPVGIVRRISRGMNKYMVRLCDARTRR